MIKNGIWGVAAVLLVGIVASGALAMGFPMGAGRQGFGRGIGGSDAGPRDFGAGDYSMYIQALDGSGKTPISQADFDKRVADMRDRQAKASAQRQKMDAVQEAIKAGDYSAYLAAFAAANAPMSQTDFDKRVADMKDRQAKEYAAKVKMDAIQAAMNASDFDAWSKAIDGTPMAAQLKTVVTKDNFVTYVQLQQAIQAKDFTKAKALSDQLGLKGFGGMRRGVSGDRVGIPHEGKGSRDDQRMPRNGMMQGPSHGPRGRMGDAAVAAR